MSPEVEAQISAMQAKYFAQAKALAKGRRQRKPFPPIPVRIKALLATPQKTYLCARQQLRIAIALQAQISDTTDAVAFVLSKQSNFTFEEVKLEAETMARSRHIWPGQFAKVTS